MVTLHRPSNVDDPVQLQQLVAALLDVQKHLPLVFPVHPRTAQRLAAAGLDRRLSEPGMRLIEPQSYIRFMSLVTGASAVITDSGGIQEETTYLGIPCLTLRENTERPITISEGTNRLVRPDTLARELDTALAAPKSERRRPRFVGRAHRRALRGGFDGAERRPRARYPRGLASKRKPLISSSCRAKPRQRVERRTASLDVASRLRSMLCSR
jgi:hypothetical protein